jgi:hypothetical protein
MHGFSPFELEEPLLPRKRENIGDYTLLAQDQYLFSGLMLFALGFFVDLIPKIWDSVSFALFHDAYALLQTCAILLMTIADLDINQRLNASARGRLAAFLFQLVVFVFAFLNAIAPKNYSSKAYVARWIPPLFLVYPLVRFIPMIQMTDFLLFTEVFVIALALGLVSSGTVDIGLGIKFQDSHRITEITIGCLNFLGAAIMLVVYRNWTKGVTTPTAKMNSAAVAYLFIIGFKDLFGKILDTSILGIRHEGLLWLYGPIHIIPTVLLICYQRKIYGSLGIRSLKQGRTTVDQVVVDKMEGNINEVRRAISSEADLNAFLQIDDVAKGTELVGAFTLLHFACWNGHIDAVKELLATNRVDLSKGTKCRGWSPLFCATVKGETACAELCLTHGADVQQPALDGITPLIAASTRGYADIVSLLIANGASAEEEWMFVDSNQIATVLQNRAVLKTIAAYESEFQGKILDSKDAKCIVSWPGVYAKRWDSLVSLAKADHLSAAVVFLPEHTVNYGKHGTDRCYCTEMYGAVKPWGCKWFQLWREHVDRAVELGQPLQVVFFEGLVGRGKIKSSSAHCGSMWDACREDALRRDSFWPQRAQFLTTLPDEERSRLSTLSSEPRNDCQGLKPGSDRADEEERMFLRWLPEEDRTYLQAQKGLGNSQKAEVAWLEKKG